MNHSGKDKLETVQKIRERIRDQKKIELSALLAEKNSLLEEEEKLQQKLADHLAAWHSLQEEKSVAIERNIRFIQYQNQLSSQQNDLRQRLTQCRLALDEKRKELEEAGRDLKIVENLRQREEDRQQEKSRRDDQKKMDDLAGRNKATDS